MCSTVFRWTWKAAPLEDDHAPSVRRFSFEMSSQSNAWGRKVRSECECEGHQLVRRLVLYPLHDRSFIHIHQNPILHHPNGIGNAFLVAVVVVVFASYAIKISLTDKRAAMVR